MSRGIYARRKLYNWLGLAFSYLAMAAGLIGLFWILWTLFYNGLGSFSADFFLNSTPAPGSPGGGMANAIVGSLMMVGAATFVSTPIGILAGIYLAEFGARSKFAAATRFVTDIMLSAPSIVIGLFIYSVVVAQVKSFSGFAGVLAKPEKLLTCATTTE